MGLTSIRVDDRAFRLSILAIGNATVSLRQASAEAISAGGEVYLRALRENLSEDDHSLSDLARLGHPYAARHGGLTLHAGDAADRIADGRQLVHRQSGALVSALRGALRGIGSRGGQRVVGATGVNPLRYEVTVDAARAPHWAWVAGGTRTMLPRDPMGATADSVPVRRAILVAIVRRLQSIRAQAAIRVT